MSGILLQDVKDPSQWDHMKMDHVTGTIATIDNDHSYIHQGNGYRAWYYQATSATTQLVFLLTTPAATATAPYVHFRPAMIATDSPLVTMKILEGTTYAAGTAITLTNSNRNSKNTAQSTLTHTPTDSVGTTVQIDEMFIGGGTGQGQSKQGDAIGGEHEIVLKPATKYAITVDFGTADTKIGIRFFLYEEEKG